MKVLLCIVEITDGAKGDNFAVNQLRTAGAPRRVPIDAACIAAAGQRVSSFEQSGASCFCTKAAPQRTADQSPQETVWLAVGLWNLAVTPALNASFLCGATRLRSMTCISPGERG